MAQQADDIAGRFEQANAEFIQKVQALSDADWKQPTAAEGWPKGVLAHHVAEGHGQIAGLIQGIASGQQLPPLTFDALNAGNAEHAQRAANCTKTETLELLRQGGTTAAAAVRGLSDEQLARKAAMPMGEMSAGQVAEAILIGHMAIHGASL